MGRRKRNPSRGLGAVEDRLIGQEARRLYHSLKDDFEAEIADSDYYSNYYSDVEEIVPAKKRRHANHFYSTPGQVQIKGGTDEAWPLCLKGLEKPHGRMRSDRSIREDLQRPLKLLLPPILRLEDVEACLVATQPDEEDIVVGVLPVPKDVRRELTSLAAAGLVVYRLPTLAESGKGKNKAPLHLQLEFCLSKEAFASVAKGPETHCRTQQAKALRVVMPWLMPHLAAEALLEVEQGASNAQELPMVKREAGAPSNDAGPSQAADEVVEDIGEADALEIYKAVKPTGKERELQGDLPQLASTLHPHQRRAASWMVDRETGPEVAAGAEQLHPLWRDVACLDGQMFYFNPYAGLLSRTRFVAPSPVPGGILADEMGMGKTVELLACILAHPFPGPAVPAELEAGERPKHERIECVCDFSCDTSKFGDYAGLWVQCSECMAWLHGNCIGMKRAPMGEYTCSKCVRAHANAMVTVDCGATLIVCPASILQQWQSEIAKHTHAGALKVLVYDSVSGTDELNLGTSKGKVLSARDFAAADVVLTTYETLQKDVHHQADVKSYGLRKAKKYEVLPTPLTRLRWWRICLDEAQMVESTIAKAAKLAVNIQAQHRWCVTGTPLSRGLEDLYGLFYFLHANPYDDRIWWREILQKPFMANCPAGRRRLMALLRPSEGGVFWRTSKADVAHEITLPPQSHRTTLLTLSAIERHFYIRQHEECVAKARAVLPAGLLAALDAGNASEEASRRLDQLEQRSFLSHLLRLRQACCHPQVGSRGVKALNPTKTPMSMDAILEVLVEKARAEAEDAQRLLLSALNGLAGLKLIDLDPAAAVALYRQVLKIAEENKPLIRVDPLQKLHTLSNLAALLADGVPKGVPRTLRDDSLQSEADDIRQGYLVQWVAKMAAAQKEYKAALKNMQRREAGPSDVSKTAAAEPEAADFWYLDAIDMLLQFTEDHGERAAAAIQNQLTVIDEMRRKAERNATSLARRFESLAGLKLLLSNELEASKEARDKALKMLEELSAAIDARPDSLVEQAATCGRCRAELGEAGRVCRHCRMDEVWLAWEMRLFRLDARAMAAGANVSAEDAVRQAQAATLRRIGVGGLNEEAAEAATTETARSAGAAEASTRRDGENVSTVDIVRHPSEAEQVLRMLPGQLRQLNHLRPRAAAQRDALLAAAKTALGRLEAGRRVFLKGRALALQQRAALYARDELAMSTLRIRVRQPGEHVKEHEIHFKLHPAELPLKEEELSTERTVADADLKKQLGTLRYLHGLRAARQRMQAGAGQAGQPNPVPGQVSAAQGQQPEAAAGPSEESEVCPVCQEPLGQELAMLPCGHQLCVKCNMAIIERIPRFVPLEKRHIACLTCRADTKVTDIALVDAGRSAATEEGSDAALADEDRIAVEGSCSTKMEAVVRRVKWLTRYDPKVKILVFSTWAEVLMLLEHALATNGVPFVRPKNRKAFEDAIATFKQAPAQGGKDNVQTLLLMLKQGANGLNLTEAQHVVLVEPVLDPAVEQQAIGRLHRIGQKAATTVHRFVVGASVEENVHKLCSARAAAMDMRAAAAHHVEAPLTVRDVALLLDRSWNPSATPAPSSVDLASSSADSSSDDEGSSGNGGPEGASKNLTCMFENETAMEMLGC